MQTFILPKHDGTKYSVTGEALTDVYYPKGAHLAGYPLDASLIKLASGEIVMYVKAVTIPHSNNTRKVEMLYRNAQAFTAQDVCEILCRNYANERFLKALNLDKMEMIA